MQFSLILLPAHTYVSGAHLCYIVVCVFCANWVLTAKKNTYFHQNRVLCFPTNQHPSPKSRTRLCQCLWSLLLFIDSVFFFENGNVTQSNKILFNVAFPAHSANCCRCVRFVSSFSLADMESLSCFCIWNNTTRLCFKFKKSAFMRAIMIVNKYLYTKYTVWNINCFNY